MTHHNSSIPDCQSVVTDINNAHRLRDCDSGTLFEITDRAGTDLFVTPVTASDSDSNGFTGFRIPVSNIHTQHGGSDAQYVLVRFDGLTD